MVLASLSKRQSTATSSETLSDPPAVKVMVPEYSYSLAHNECKNTPAKATETYEYVIWTFYAMSLPLRSRKVMAAIHPDRAREACGSPWPAGTGTPLLKKDSLHASEVSR